MCRNGRKFWQARADAAHHNGAQENFDNFSAVQDKMKKYAPIHGKFFVFAPDSARGDTTYYLNTRSELPKGWSYNVAGGAAAVTLSPDQTREVPVDIVVPDGTPVGETYHLSTQALTLMTITNDLIPAGGSVPKTHVMPMLAGGVVLAARTVLPSALTLTANAGKTGEINAKGVLDPALATYVSVDFTDAHGTQYSRLAKTDATDHYMCAFESPERDTNWTLRALWQGDKTHDGAVSPERGVVSLVGNPNGHPEKSGVCGK